VRRCDSAGATIPWAGTAAEIRPTQQRAARRAMG
jgi:hypothetical protein